MSRSGKFFLLICDLVLYLGSVLAIAFFREGLGIAKVVEAPGHWFIAVIVITLLYIFGAYDFNHGTSSSRLVGRTFLALVTGLLLVIFIHYVGAKDRAGIFGRGILFGSFVLFGAVSLFNRWLVANIAKKSLRKVRYLLVGSREIYEIFEGDLKSNAFRSQIFYCLDRKQEHDPHSIVGTWAQLHEILRSNFQMIAVALNHSFPVEAMNALMLARFETNRVKDVAQFYEEVWQKVPLGFLEPRWFLSVEGFSLMGNPIRLRVKRLMDVLISFVMLLLASPLMIVTALAIRLESQGNAIYKQTRTGRAGKPFVIYKFRSMVQDAEKSGAQWAQKNDSRVTTLGSFLRKTRIDELPQLFNILGGSMSFVGPRPERPEFVQELEKQIEYYNFRHMVQPGLTGWAQILYPYGASLQDAKEKLQYDLFYIKNHSVWLDISIVLKTVTVVLFGRGR